jgi:putative membrane protein insertion efficiency factor
MSSVAIFLLRVYQKTLSPVLYRFGLRCRFYPSCSDYAILVFRQYGFKAGVAQMYRRLLRCRPDNLDSCIDFPPG